MVKMKIAYVGNFTQKHCTECHLSLTLEKLGHEVVRLQEDSPATKQWLDDDLAVIQNIELFLFTRTWGNTVTLDHLENLKRHKIPTASYHLDLYIGLARKYLHNGKNIEEVFKTDPFWKTDYVFTPDGDEEHAKIFKANGVNHYYMKPGVFEDECIMSKSDRFKYDVLFVGGGDRIGSPHIYGHPEWNYRNELITWLYDTYGDTFTKFGHPQETIRNEKLNQLYADTKVVVGDSVCLRGFTQTHYWSDRVYETIGRGGFLIHPYIKGLEEEFIDGKTIVFYEYGNFDDLKNKIDFYSINDLAREKIRKAGHKFVKENCTYTHRLILMLKTIVWNKTVHDMVKKGLDVKESIKINFGSGNDPKEGYINVDMLKRDDVDAVHNLMDFPYPFENNSATHIQALDVLEHLDHYTEDRRPTIIAFFEECYRILQTGGELYIQVPSWNTDIFEIDVTHVRGFNEKSFDFLDPETWYGEIRDFYTDAKFKIIKKEKFENGVMRFWFKKI